MMLNVIRRCFRDDGRFSWRRCFLVAWIVAIWIAGGGPCAEVVADTLRVAIISGDESGREIATAAEQLGRRTVRFTTADSAWQKLRTDASEFDIVVGTHLPDGLLPHHDAGRDERVDVKVLQTFMENGGALVLTGASEANCLTWLTLLDPKLELTAIHPNPRPKDFKIEDANPAHTFRSVPTPLQHVGGIEQAYKLKTPGEWEQAERWANLPCTLVKRFGKGLLVLSTLQYSGRELLENTATMLRLQRLGIQYRGLAHQFGSAKDFSPGAGETSLLMRSTSTQPLTATGVVRLTDGTQTREVKRSVFDVKPGAPSSIAVPIMADLRGATSVQAAIVDPTDGSEILLWKEQIHLPEFLTVVPPAYRGMISTARRDKNVHFKIRTAPLYENIERMTLAITIGGPNGEVVAATELTATAEEFPVTMELAADAPVGTYTITATAKRGRGRDETARTTFRIVPVRPGQVFIDQDAVILRDGKPFFPLGIYHVNGEEVDRAADLGFNLFQFWNWDATPENMDRLAAKGISVVWEGQAWGRAVSLKPSTVMDNPGFLQELSAMREAAARYKNHPALAMWYVADEPGPYHLPALQHINRVWHKEDEDHPTYLMATGEYDKLQAACDVLAIDVYLVYRGNRNHLSRIANATDAARKGVQYRKPVIAVPQAFGNNERHREKPEEVRCMSYLHLTHGVQGLMWYCWKETGDPTGVEGAGNHPETQHVLKQLVAELQVFAPALLEPGARTLRSEDGRVHARLCGSDAVGRYLLFVNDDSAPSEAVLHIPELTGRRLTGLFGTPAATAPDGTVRLHVAPLATGVFRIE